MERQTTYEESFILEGHNDGVRDICFLNAEN
jgi:hypothetical protein